MSSDIFSKLCVGVAWFVILTGAPQATGLPATTGQWQAHTFAPSSSLFNVHLVVMKDLDILCDIPPTNATHSVVYEDKQSVVFLINSTFLLLVTTLQNAQFFLEYGHMKTKESHFAGSFNDSREALEHFIGKTDTPQFLGHPSSRLVLIPGLSLVLILLLLYCGLYILGLIH